MKELIDIVNAYDTATRLGKRTALATVVHVEGSSYRRPGARMLVTEDGQLTGAISGGCLEGDALRKAVLAISQGKTKLVIYDTTDEDDARIGIQLGCNGIVSILFEPIHTESNQHPIQIIRSIIDQRKPAVLITGYSLNKLEHLGTINLPIIHNTVSEQIEALSMHSLETGNSLHEIISMDDNRQQFLFAYYQPPIKLMIVGAGNDAIPVSEIAHTLGWTTIVIDGRPSHATAARFPNAQKILVGKAADVMIQEETDERTALVLMTHNYQYDKAILEILMQKPLLPYIGILGPAAKRDRMLAEIKATEANGPTGFLQNIYGPTGLDLGAETANEIALSITAEIMAMLQQKNPIHLREKVQPIHAQKT
jgi:xanthine/CO dehydrogenase XdhC/CoxF family maturation factor